MRTLSTSEQDERKRKLLQAIIHQYIKTAKPVGSAYLAEQYRLGLSPATIRNVMAELEQEGYLTHPHTSAGRVPTDKAYRFYVDSLVDLQRMALAEEEHLRQEYEERIRQINELMLSTSRTLSVMSKYTGFVLSPKFEETHLRHLELIPLDAGRVLVVMVSDSGLVKHRVVAVGDQIPADLLPSLTKVLNEQLRGKTFSEVREQILDHIEFWGQRQREMVDLARGLMREAFDLDDEEIFLEGASNILSLPDFRDFEQMRSLAHLLEEKRLIGDVIMQDLSQRTETGGRWPDVTVKIGSENKFPELKELSLVSTTYKIHDRTVGALGIIGPKRMDYSRMIHLVRSVAASVSRVLNRFAGGEDVQPRS
jgi:heat-inducible transcriptional repressor